MEKTESLLRGNYLAHKAKKAKQWKKKRQKAAAKKKELEKLIGIGCPDCNCIPCCCQAETY